MMAHMKKEEPKKAISVILEESLIREVKSAAVLSGKKMADWIAESFRATLGKKKAAK